MAYPKGTLVIVDDTGKINGFTPGTNNNVLVADSTQTYGIKYAAVSPALFNSTNMVLVDKSGNDGTGQRNGNPFLTIVAALAVAQSGDVVLVNPGTYAENITIPAGVHLKGVSMANTIVSTSVSSETDLVTLGTSCILENFTLNLTSSAHVQLRGIIFSSTSATTSRVSNCSLTIDNSGAGVGTSIVIGIYSGGTGNASNYFNNLYNVNSYVASTSSGVKRALLLDTSANSINARNCGFVTSGGTDSIGAETNNASAILTIRNSYCEGTIADISQTAGTINIANTLLQNSNINGKSFNTIDVFPNTLQYSLSGAVTSNSTRYMRISDATSTNEIKQIFYRKCLIKNMYVRSRVAPGSSNNDVFTIRKNGVDTSLVATLSTSSTSTSNTTTSVTFAANDDISLKLVTGSNSSQADIVVTVEIY